MTRRRGDTTKPGSISLLNILLVLNGLALFMFHFRSNESCEQEKIGDDDDDYVAASSVASISSSTATAAVNSEHRSFYDIALKTGTDKVLGETLLPKCINENQSCVTPDAKREVCRPWGHFYHTMYQSRLEKYSTDDTEPFQLLEIGFYTGHGYDAFSEFLPQAEAHSMEISCQSVASQNKNYNKLVNSGRLHCGNASNIEWAHKIWSEKMKRKDSPPLKIVIDDGSHMSHHMATSVFFWFPRIEPGGLMIVEDVQPIKSANKFRTEFLPQIMADLHYCGDPQQSTIPNDPCFPTLMPLLQSIHCEMHICIFERNSMPATEPDLEQSKMAKNALDLSQCSSLKL